MSKEEQDKVIIHELMHIPQTFGGGFRHHDFVCDGNIDFMYDKFAALKKEKQGVNNESKVWWKKN